MALLGVMGCSRAAETPAAAPEAHPAVIQTLQSQGFEVYGEFPAPGGLRGYAGVAAQRPMTIYVTPDGEHAVLGVMVDAKGQDVGQQELQRLVIEPMSKRVWTQLEKSRWVLDGRADAPRVVYVFSDPNCPYCHRFWSAARPWVDAGKVQLRHVLVGVIREDSANKAAAILGDKSPPDALARSERDYDKGGVKGVAEVSPTIRAQLEVNERLMTELGFEGTPGIVYRDATGALQKLSGVPMGDDLSTVLGPR